MCKTILVANMKGGIGKTTISFNLANNIAKNAKVAILDFDLQGSLTQIKDLVTNFDIIPYVKDLSKIKDLNYDCLFIDSPPYLTDQLAELINIADLIIIPTKPGILDLLAIDSTMKLIESQNKYNQSLIVFNMVKPNTTLTKDILKGLEEYPVNIASTMISDLVVFTRSVLINGVESSNKAQRQLDNLTREVLIKLI